jgi:hypothetical protein
MVPGLARQILAETYGIHLDQFDRDESIEIMHLIRQDLHDQNVEIVDMDDEG